MPRREDTLHVVSTAAGQVGLCDRSYGSVDRAGAVLMGTRHEDLLIANTLHQHTVEEQPMQEQRRPTLEEQSGLIGNGDGGA